MSQQGAYIQAWVDSGLKVRFKQACVNEPGGMTAVLKRLVEQYCDHAFKQVEVKPDPSEVSSYE